jgi:hypothetical protein
MAAFKLWILLGVSPNGFGGINKVVNVRPRLKVPVRGDVALTMGIVLPPGCWATKSFVTRLPLSDGLSDEFLGRGSSSPFTESVGRHRESMIYSRG